MALILAIEPDRRQASQLNSMVRGRLRAELVLADSAERALAALGDRVPDLILTTALLSPKDEVALGERLRKLDGIAAHVQTLTIPMLASPRSQASSGGRGGVLSALIGDRPQSAMIEGCDPAVFAEQCAAYLERAAAERASHAHLIDEHFEEPAPPVERPHFVQEPEFVDDFVSVQPETPVASEPSPSWQPFADETSSVAQAFSAAEVTSPEFTAEETYAVAQPFRAAEHDTPAESFTAAEHYSPAQPFGAAEHYTPAQPFTAAETFTESFAAPSDALTDLDAALDLVLVDDDAEQDEAIQELEQNVIELDLSTLVEDEDAIVKEFSVPNDPTATIASAVLAVVEAEEQAARAAQAQPAATAPVIEPKNPVVQPKKKIERDAWIPTRLGVTQLWPAMDSYVADRRPAAEGVDSDESQEATEAAAASAPSAPARRRSKAKPIEDEWGFFDPDQCGFAALLAKLEEIADGDDKPVTKRPA
jgi:hypothetical protein